MTSGGPALVKPNATAGVGTEDSGPKTAGNDSRDPRRK